MRSDSNSDDRPIIHASKLSLPEWLDLIGPHPDDRRYRIADYEFPTDAHREEYLATLDQRTEREVKGLLRNFLVIGGGYQADYRLMDHLISGGGDLLSALDHFEFVKRLLSSERHAWEGNTWILDLLPGDPQKAIDAVGSYITAHVQFLTDGRWSGLEDAITIIKKRYLEAVHPQDALLRLSPREFEILVALIYRRMGYQVDLTPPVRDGGYDVAAKRSDVGGRNLLLIECKRYTDAVRIKDVRALLGVVESHRATKGVLVTSSRFSRDAHQYAAATHRLELIDYPALNGMLNRCFGIEWPTSVDFHLRLFQRETITQSLQHTAERER